MEGAFGLPGQPAWPGELVRFRPERDPDSTNKVNSI